MKVWVPWLLGTLEVCLGMAVAVWLLTSPALFRLYYPALRVSTHSRDAAAVVDWLSTEYRERSLNLALVDGKLGRKELRHFSDVRRVFRWLPGLAMVLALSTGLLLVAAKPSGIVLLAAQYRGLLVWTLFCSFVGGLAWWNWKLFFALVHQPFFGSTSWRLPDDCYSLRLFPTPFWRDLVTAVLVAPVLLTGGVILTAHIAAKLAPGSGPARPKEEPLRLHRASSAVRARGSLRTPELPPRT